MVPTTQPYGATLGTAVVYNPISTLLQLITPYVRYHTKRIRLHSQIPPYRSQQTFYNKVCQIPYSQLLLLFRAQQMSKRRNCSYTPSIAQNRTN